MTKVCFSKKIAICMYVRVYGETETNATISLCLIIILNPTKLEVHILKAIDFELSLMKPSGTTANNALSALGKE